MTSRAAVTVSLLVLVLVGLPSLDLAAEPLVVSVWGGNWKDTVEKIVAKPFTAKTGIPVEFNANIVAK